MTTGLSWTRYASGLSICQLVEVGERETMRGIRDSDHMVEPVLS